MQRGKLMMVAAERFEELKASSRATNWRGRSGRFYALAAARIDAFSLDGAELYLLAADDCVLWVGTAADLIGEPSSRARFRAAMLEADAVFHVAAPQSDVDRMTLIWDLEGAEPVTGLSAA